MIRPFVSVLATVIIVLAFVSLSLPLISHSHLTATETRLSSIARKITNSLIKAVYSSPPVDSDVYTTLEQRARKDHHDRYDGDVVLRFNISTEMEARALAHAVDTLFLDTWEFTPEWADIRVAKDIAPALLALLPNQMRGAQAPLIHDLAQAVYDSLHTQAPQDPDYSQTSRGTRGISGLKRTRDETSIFFSKYQPLSVIVPWMRLMSSLFSSHVRMVNIGASSEGRNILGLRVGVQPRNADKPSKPRKVIVLSAGSHAREWISVSSVTYAAYSLITSYGKDKQITKLIEEFDFVFIPTLNPDGYVYSWDTDRLWRKNRQETSLQFCRGLDVDKSFSFKWEGESTKSNPCSESYAGDVPFQAIEALRFANWTRNETSNNNVTFVGYIDLHSYSQQVLYPYAWSCISSPPTLENLEELGLGLARAIHRSGGEFYGVTSACEGSVAVDKELRGQRMFWPRVEPTGGTALDWMYHEMGVKYSYQIKLRDTGTSGFLLSPKAIKPTGEEVFSALTYFGNYLLSNKGVESTDNSPSSSDISFSKPALSQNNSAVHGTTDEQLDPAGDDLRFDLK